MRMFPHTSGKVLFLGGGRRVELANKFIKRGYLVDSYELTENVPISSAANIILGKEWKDLTGEELYSLGKEYTFIFPLQDEATTCLLDESYPFIVSSYETCEVCFDKKLFEQYMLLNFYYLYPQAREGRNAIIKSRFGFGSRKTEKILSYDSSMVNENNWIAQEYIKGKEYSVDCYFDPEGKLEDLVPRLRIRVGSGEVITSKTEKIHYKWFERAIEDVSSKLYFRGPINFQFILETSSMTPFLFEINARFGGGFTLSMEAGLDVISLLERDYLNEPIEYPVGEWKDGLLLERSYRDHYYETF